MGGGVAGGWWWVIGDWWVVGSRWSVAMWLLSSYSDVDAMLLALLSW